MIWDECTECYKLKMSNNQHSNRNTKYNPTNTYQLHSSVSRTDIREDSSSKVKVEVNDDNDAVPVALIKSESSSAKVPVGPLLPDNCFVLEKTEPNSQSDDISDCGVDDDRVSGGTLQIVRAAGSLGEQVKSELGSSVILENGTNPNPGHVIQQEPFIDCGPKYEENITEPLVDIDTKALPSTRDVLKVPANFDGLHKNDCSIIGMFRNLTQNRNSVFRVGFGPPVIKVKHRKSTQNRTVERKKLASKQDARNDKTQTRKHSTEKSKNQKVVTQANTVIKPARKSFSVKHRHKNLSKSVKENTKLSNATKVNENGDRKENACEFCNVVLKSETEKRAHVIKCCKDSNCAIPWRLKRRSRSSQDLEVESKLEDHTIPKRSIRISSHANDKHTAILKDVDNTLTRKSKRRMCHVGLQELLGNSKGIISKRTKRVAPSSENSEYTLLKSKKRKRCNTEQLQPNEMEDSNDILSKRSRRKACFVDSNDILSKRSRRTDSFVDSTVILSKRSRRKACFVDSNDILSKRSRRKACFVKINRLNLMGDSITTAVNEASDAVKKVAEMESATKENSEVPDNSKLVVNVQSENGTCQDLQDEHPGDSGLTVDSVRYSKADKSKKDHSCYFCGMLTSKLLIHFQRSHADDPKLKNILLPSVHSKSCKRSKYREQKAVRKREVEKLRNHGDFLHNVVAIQKNQGVLIAKVGKNTRPESLLPCVFCYSFVQKSTVMSHFKNCVWVQDGGADIRKQLCNMSEERYSRACQWLLYGATGHTLLNPFTEQFKKVIVKKLEKDEDGIIALRDPLIKKLGLIQLKEHAVPLHKGEDIVDQLKVLGQLFKHLLKEMTESCESISDFLTKKWFGAVVYGVKSVCGNTDQSHAFTVMENLEMIAIVKKGEALHNQDERKKQDAEGFIKLCQMNMHIAILYEVESGSLKSVDWNNFLHDPSCHDPELEESRKTTIQIKGVANNSDVTVGRSEKKLPETQTQLDDEHDTQDGVEMTDSPMSTIDDISSGTVDTADHEDVTQSELNLTEDDTCGDIENTGSGEILGPKMQEEHPSSVGLYTKSVKYSQADKGKKQHSCYFCGILTAGLYDHFERCHKDELEFEGLVLNKKERISLTMEQIIAMRSSRKIVMEKYRNLGNFLHNMEAIEKNSGVLIVKYGKNTTAESYIPCVCCYVFVQKSLLLIHFKHCHSGDRNMSGLTDDGISEEWYAKACKWIMYGSTGDTLLKETREKFTEYVVTKLQNDEAGKIALQDPLINKAGQIQFKERAVYKADEITEQLKVLGRLLESLWNETDQIDIGIAEFLSRSWFSVLIYRVKTICCKGNMEHALKITDLLEMMAILKKAVALRAKDETRMKDAESFIKLYRQGDHLEILLDMAENYSDDEILVTGKPIHTDLKVEASSLSRPDWEKGGKLRKQHFCLFCDEMVSRISDHLIRCHKTEPEVQNIPAVPTNNIELTKDEVADIHYQRSMELGKLRNLGNFIHNIKAIKQRKGAFVVGHRLINALPQDFVPCSHCLIFSLKHDLVGHLKICQFRTREKDEDLKWKERGFMTSCLLLLCGAGGQGLLEALQEEYDNHVSKVLGYDDIDSLIRADQTMKKVGMVLLDEHGVQHSELVIKKLRVLGKVLVELRNGLGAKAVEMENFLSTTNFEICMETVNTVCNADLDPELAQKTEELLEKVALLKRGRAIKHRDYAKEVDAQLFVDMLQARRVQRLMSDLEKKKYSNFIMGRPSANITPFSSTATTVVSYDHTACQFAASPQREPTRVMQKEPSVNRAVNVGNSLIKADKMPKTSRDNELRLHLKRQLIDTETGELAWMTDSDIDIDEDKEHQDDPTDVDKVKVTTESGLNSDEIPTVGYKRNEIDVQALSSLTDPMYTDPNWCWFCEKRQTEIMKHLRKSHKNEPNVIKIPRLPTKDVQLPDAQMAAFVNECRLALQTLRNLCILYRNVVAIQENEGILVVKNKLDKCIPQDFLPCCKCYLFIPKSELLHHSKLCGLIFDTACAEVYCILTSSLLLYGAGGHNWFDSSLYSISSIHNDSKGIAAKADRFLTTYGLLRSQNLGNTSLSEMHSDLRTMATLLLEVRKLTGDGDLQMERLIKCDAFELCVKGAKIIFTQIYKLNKSFKLGQIFGQLGILKMGEALKERDGQKKEDAENFFSLCQKDWLNKTRGNQKAEEHTETVIKEDRDIESNSEDEIEESSIYLGLLGTGDSEQVQENTHNLSTRKKWETRFAGISIQTLSFKKCNKKHFRKRHCCYFCKKMCTKISLHVVRAHKTEEVVKRLMSLQLDTSHDSVDSCRPMDKQKEKRLCFDQLRNLGDFFNNMNVLTQNQGVLIVKRGQDNSIAEEYMPCMFCYSFIMRSDMYYHEHRCMFRYTGIRFESEEQQDIIKKGYYTVCMLLLFGMGDHAWMECFCPDFMKDVMFKLPIDDTSRTIINDVLLCQFGKAQYERTRVKQVSDICSQLRILGQLLMQLRIIDGNEDVEMGEFLTSGRFDMCVEAVKRLVMTTDKKESVPDRDILLKPDFAVVAGQRLRDLAVFKSYKAVEDQDPIRKDCADHFIGLYKEEWHDRVRGISQRVIRQQITKEVESSLMNKGAEIGGFDGREEQVNRGTDINSANRGTDINSANRGTNVNSTNRGTDINSANRGTDVNSANRGTDVNSANRGTDVNSANRGTVIYSAKSQRESNLASREGNINFANRGDRTGFANYVEEISHVAKLSDISFTNRATEHGFRNEALQTSLGSGELETGLGNVRVEPCLSYQGVVSVFGHHGIEAGFGSQVGIGEEAIVFEYDAEIECSVQTVVSEEREENRPNVTALQEDPSSSAYGYGCKSKQKKTLKATPLTTPLIPGKQREQNKSSCRKIKQQKWSAEEETLFQEMFTDEIARKQMPSHRKLELASKQLGGRSKFVIRTKLNKILSSLMN